MKLYPFLLPPLIGIDIQANELKFIQVRKTKKFFLIEQAAKIKLADDTLSDGKIKNWDYLHIVLVELVQKFGLTGMAAAINLSTNLVRMQQIQIPKGLPSVAIEEEIKSQLAREFPGFNDSISIDYKVSTANDSAYDEVFFVVARQEYISQYVHCVNSAGLRVKMVDVDICALKRILTFTHKISLARGEVIALICMVNGLATFMVFTEQAMLYHQKWDMNKANEFIVSIKSCIQIFIATFPHKKIKHLAFFSNDTHFNEAMKETPLSFEYTFILRDPFASIRLSQHLYPSMTTENIFHYLIACGCAMREVPKW